MRMICILFFLFRTLSNLDKVLDEQHKQAIHFQYLFLRESKELRRTTEFNASHLYCTVLNGLI